MLEHWVWLAERKHLSDYRKWEILQQFGSPEKVYFADSYEDVEDLSVDGNASLLDKDLGPAGAILEKCLRHHLQILTIQDAQYPEKLRNIGDPPLILYYQGRLPDFNGNAAVGVVGTRHASAYGLSVAKRMGFQIAKCGGILVSGLAWGIDAAAMEGGLMGGGTVVGVLGCGADVVYPIRNRRLFESTAKFGCILSEFPPESEAAPWHFPKRNRIISGLSDGVLVVEAPIKSGALITARQALEQGRDVFVVPGNLGVASCEGSNSLLREGAGAVGCGWDVLSEYSFKYPGKLHEENAQPEGTKATLEPVAEPRVLPRKTEKKASQKQQEKAVSGAQVPAAEPAERKISIDKTAPQPYIDINDILRRCNSQEKAIVLALSEGERLVDEVIAETGLKTAELLASLTMLEIKGILKRLPGRRIALQETIASKRRN